MEASCSGSKEFDETRESIESLKNESEKLGNPHCEHIHVREVLARISYIGKSTLLHLVWYQTSHMSHCIPFWLLFAGLAHSPHGCLYWGPGFSSMFPLRNSSESSNRLDEFFAAGWKMVERASSRRRQFTASKPAWMGRLEAKVKFIEMLSVPFPHPTRGHSPFRGGTKKRMTFQTSQVGARKPA